MERINLPYVSPISTFNTTADQNQYNTKWFFSAAFLNMFANSTVQATGKQRNLQFLRFVEQYQEE